MIAKDFCTNPEANILQACETRAKTKAAYRFFAESEKTMEEILAIAMVVAWRIFHLTKIEHETPYVPGTVFFEDAEMKAFVVYKI